jgi:hypothetical protein
MGTAGLRVDTAIDREDRGTDVNVVVAHETRAYRGLHLDVRVGPIALLPGWT